MIRSNTTRPKQNERVGRTLSVALGSVIVRHGRTKSTSTALTGERPTGGTQSRCFIDYWAARVAKEASLQA